MNKINKLIIYTDGASKGNPGKAGAGVVFKNDDNKTIGEFSLYLTTVTNNQAEYAAVILALHNIRAFPYTRYVELRSDSLLVVKQLNGDWSVRDKLIAWFIKVEEIKNKLADEGIFITFIHIPREENAEADRLANKAIEDYEK